MSSVVDLDRRAVEISVDIVRGISAGQFARPTPCAGWNLGDLLGHMIAQHHGFAAAAEGNGADASAWRVHPVGEDPPAAYAAAARPLRALIVRHGAALATVRNLHRLRAEHEALADALRIGDRATFALTAQHIRADEARLDRRLAAWQRALHNN
jgi:uncharacterized protein (TIGR03083 family)